MEEMTDCTSNRYLSTWFYLAHCKPRISNSDFV